MIKVPFFSTIPSRLTHMHNPTHDRVFLKNLSIRKNIKIIHEFNEESLLPNSKNTLKNIKNLFD